MTETTASRLLLTERAAILPILRALPAERFDTPTLLPGWSVRDVLAHCAAALGAASTGNLHGFSPAENQVDVDARKGWPIARLLDELEGGYSGGAAAIAAAGGRLDLLALGEWTHGGDVRDALGISNAYASPGIDEALELVVAGSRSDSSKMPATVLQLEGRPELLLGTAEPTAKLAADTATFVRMLGRRNANPARFKLTGAEPSQYVIFGG
ncbi:MAG TPA: maleylpyruvate isomerase family mycothiol-dependent enzyme [Micromonosporaceae bacterium]